MILLLFHDRSSKADVAGLKSAIEECYSPYGLRVQDSGYLYVPLQGTRLNAAQLLKHLGRAHGTKKALWLVDSELFYPGIGAVLGCSVKSAALLYANLEPEVLIKEALHEVGHLLGLEHCQQSCIMRLSCSPEEAKLKPSRLCPACSTQLKARPKRP